jgi:phosphatidate phosphatase LPIN
VRDEEDTESGQGASLPQSPVPHDHPIIRPAAQFGHLPGNVSMSLCGGLKEHTEITSEKFDQFLVTYDRFCEDPSVLNDPNLVIKIQDK